MQPSGPTVSVGKSWGGVARNIIPREARLSWEIRFRAGDDPDLLLKDASARIVARLRASFGERFDVLTVETREASRTPAFDPAAGPSTLSGPWARGAKRAACPTAPKPANTLLPAWPP